MKKHLIAVAVAAAVAVPAVAQVTVSGTLDINPHASTKTTIGAATPETSKITRTDNGAGGWSTSTLNFTATEDLGGGLKATAFVNQVINQTSGEFTARDRFVSLDSGFGSFKAGRFSPAIEGYGSYAVAGTTNTAGTSDSSGYDFITGSLGYDNAIARSITLTTAALNTSTIDAAFDRTAGDMGRQAGVVQLSTPTFNGFKGTVELVKNSTDRDAAVRPGAGEKNDQSVRLDFTQGNLALSIATGKSKSTREAAAASNLITTANTTNGLISAADAILISGTREVLQRQFKSEVSWLGASYNFGVARALFAHGERKDNTSTNGAAEATSSDLKVTNFGVIVPVGAISLTASYYKGKDSRTILTTDDVDLKGHQLGARYALSKRTFAYGVMGENKTTLSSGATTAGTTKVTGSSIGVVHSF